MAMRCSSLTIEGSRLKTEKKHVAYLGLGSNLGDRETNISRATELIAEQAGDVVRQSAFYYSEPWGFASENAFVNTVICIHTALTPRQLLHTTQRIERRMGKGAVHATQRGEKTVYHDRPIDIDILLYDDVVISTPMLTIPHPLMLQRPFVMEPLSQVLPPGHPLIETMRTAHQSGSTS